MIARPEGPIRKIKRIVQEKANPQSQNTLKYQFYRDILHPTILKLKNEIDKLNYSTWLARLDLEDEDKKILLIKMLLISLKNKEPFYIFANFPPEDLSELNLELQDNNAMGLLKILQDDTNLLLAHKIMPQENRYKRSAAVATDMRSYISTKTSPYLVQSFYAKSDFPIRLWDNPSTIILPISNIDHNQWDLYMDHFNILSQKKADGKKHQNDCKSLKVDQVSKEVTTSFRWHPNSLLSHSDRPKRSACFLEADQDITNQPVTQELIENAAFDIVYEKSFPGHKILNARIYCTLMMPDPKYIFTMTNVKIIYNNTTHIAYINYKQKNQCKKRNVKVPDNCLKTDECKSICILPFETQYPCSEIAMHNSNPFQKTCNTTCPVTCNSTTLPKINTVKTRNDSEYMQSNQTNSPCDKTFACSRSENKSLECNEKRNVTNCEQNISSKQQSMSSNSQSNQTNSLCDKTFACSRSENKSLECNEKRNVTNCEQNMSSKQQSMSKNSQSNETNSPCDKTFACSRSENKSLECNEKQNVTNCERSMSSKQQSMSNNSQSNQTNTPRDKTFACSRSGNKNLECDEKQNATNYEHNMSSKQQSMSNNSQSNQTNTPRDKTFACSRSGNKNLECDEKQNATNYEHNMSSKQQSMSNNSQSNQTNTPRDKTFACSRSGNKNLECDEKQNATNYEHNMSSEKQSMSNTSNSLCSSISSQNHTNSRQHNTINNNQSRAHIIPQPSNVHNSSLDDSSNYDWTMSYVESSPNQNVAQDCNCTPNDSSGIHAEQRCNQLPCLESTNRSNQVLEHEERPSHRNNRRSLPAMNSNFSNTTDTITKPKYDENFDPNISSYSRFSNRINHSEGPKNQTIQKTSSYHNLPNTSNNYNQDTHKTDESLDFSREIDFRPARPNCNCNNSGSQMTSTAFPNSSLGNFGTDNNRINDPLPMRNNNMSTCGCQIDNIQRHDLDDRNIENMMDMSSNWENQTFNEFPRSNNEHRNMPSDLMSFPRDDFQNLENMTMPNNSYEPLNSNNMSVDDYSDIRNMSMPNNSLD